MITIYMNNHLNLFQCESDLQGYLDLKYNVEYEKFIEFDNKFINTSLIEYVEFEETNE